MALKPRSLELSLIKGIDTKTDPKQVPFGKLLNAENTTFVKPGRIQKREGFQSVSRQIIGSASSIDNGQAVMNFKQELIAFDNNNIYSYIEGTNNWRDKGNFQSIYLTSKALTNGTAEDYGSDSAVHLESGYQCIVFSRIENNINSLYYQVIDGDTGQLIIGPVLIKEDNCLDVKVAVFGNNFIIMYRDTNQNRLYKAALPLNNVVSPITFSAITDNSTNKQSINSTYPAYLMNVLADSAGTEYLYVAFTNRGSPTSVTMWQFVSPTTLSPSNVAYLNSVGIYTGQLFKELYTDGLVILFNDPFSGGKYVRFAGYSMDLSTQNFAETVTTPSNDNAYLVTGVSKSSASIDLDIYYTYDNPQTQTRRFTYDGSTITVINDILNVAIAGTAYVYAGKSYIPIVGGPNLTSLTNSYFLLDENGACLARYLYALADGKNVKDYSIDWKYYWIPKTNQLNDTNFIVSVRNITTFGDISGQEQTGLTKITFDFFEPEKSYSRTEIADSLYIGGGELYQYDGQNLVEDSFNWLPEIATITSATTGSTYSYSYVACWEWVDNAGSLHRSAPCTPQTVEVGIAIGPSGSSVSMSLYPLTLTEKTTENNRTPPVAVVYRTKANSDVYFKLPVTNANKNDPTALYIIPAADTTLDTDLTEPIYTTGDVLANDPPPPIGSMVVHRNRLFILDSTNPLQIWYSKLVAPDISVDWSSFNVLNVDPNGGDISGLASLDDKLIIFKESQIRYITGQGPDDTGANNDFGDSILITTDAGCNNLRSIIYTPDGLIFKSTKGIYMLNRGLQVGYIGAAVEDFNDDTITSATLMKTNNQIRLTLNSNKALVYDYYVQAWSVFTNVNAVDSIVWNNHHAYIRSNGQVMIETPNTFTDDGSSYSMKITTSWLNFTGIQGFERIWKFYILGDYRSAHQLQVDLSYDYNNSIYQTITLTPETPDYYGGATPYGSGSYGGDVNNYQYRINVKKQKCMSMKATIQDIPLSGSLEEGMFLSNLRFDIGVIGGSNRVKAAQQAG